MIVQTPETNRTQEQMRGGALPPEVRGAEDDGAPLRQALIPLALLAIVLTACFALPLYDLLRFSLRNDLYSHIGLVPFISGYVVWLRRQEWAAGIQPARRAALVFALIGLALVAAYWIACWTGWEPEFQDRLCVLTLAFLLLFCGACAWRLGGSNLRRYSFPLAFLLFMVPLPLALERGIEALLQHASADTSYALLRISGMSVYRLGTAFLLPGFSFNVAPECSGIHSTLVLFMSSLLAGHFFFRFAWTRAVLAAGVLVLGVLRNAMRIFTLAQLCVRVDPNIINSPLHHRGGPLFFIVSLLPFFLFIWLLRKIERRSKK